MIFGEKSVDKPIRWSMIGGGRGSQIGYIHRSAALRDFNFELAEELEALVKKSGKIMFVSYGYAGHQMIEQARQMVARGDLGKIRILNMQFAHGGNNVAVEKNAASQAWRVDPKKAGPAFSMGDVGTHMLYLSEAICPELHIKRLMCTKQSFVEGRQLEDNAMSIMEYDNGAIGYIWSSGVNAGEQFGFRIRIVGEKASVAWDAEKPNYLSYEVQGESPRLLGRGNSYLYPEALADDRIGGGHPEGLFEAWSNLYTKFALAIDRCEKGETIDFWYPDIHAGVLGVKWVDKCVESADKDSAWIAF